MRKIYTVFLMVNLFVALLQTTFVNGGNRLPGGKTLHTSTPLACPVPGTYTIGPGGDYASITLAIADLSSCPGLTGAYIFEFKATYSSAVETFPVTIPNFTGSSAVNTITFRPEIGATGLSITSANTTGTILFDGGDFITFDGRPGGTGTAKELTIQNTNSGNSYAIRFVNDATDNTITYCTVRSANNNAAGATIIIAGTNGSTGNDNITIDNNDIREVSAVATPSNGILSAGSTGSATLYNNNIVISNNNILNFYNSTGNVAGILVTQGSSDWTITGNNFNHTFGSAKSAGGIFSAVNAYNSQMSNFTITNNYVGGTVALASGGNINLFGIASLQVFRLSLSTATVNNIQGNTVWNIIFTAAAFSNAHAIFNLADGSFNVGNTTPNTVGSPISTGNIAMGLNNNTAGNNFAIISCGTGSTGMGAVNISNNSIGNIDILGTSSVTPAQGIYFTGNTGTYTISNNTIGSSTYNPSINNYLSTEFTAILGNMSSGSHIISNNSVINVWQPATGSNGVLYGIKVSGNASYQVTGNTVTGFRSSVSGSPAVPVIGISNTASGASQTIASNKLQTFSTAATTKSSIIGIYYAGPATGTNIIEKNFIHSFSSASTATTTQLVGIYAAGGVATYKNNMVRMGLNSTGGQVVTAYDINGIYEESGTNDFYFNSVYVGGNGVTAGSASYAFNSAVNSGVTRNYKNNIFFNARSNASGNSPKHYAIKAASATGISSDYNVLFANGNGQMIANLGGTDLSTLALWRSAVSGDANSYSMDPQFVAPTGSAVAVDLHIKPSPTPSIAESNGINIPSVSDDYDAQTRATLTPTDIGADAGNFTAVPKADIGPVNMLNPISFACNNAATQIKMVIKNYNNAAINFASAPVTITLNVTGAVTANLSAIVNTGTLAAGDTLIVTFVSTLNMSAAGTYNFLFTTSVGGSLIDFDLTNNTYSTTVTPSPYNIGVLSSSVVNFCNSGIPVLTLTGTAGVVQWQESTVSNSGPWTNVGTNSLTYTPTAITATTYYQAVVSCGAGSGPSNVVTVFVIPASIANTASLANGVSTIALCEGSNVTLTQSGGSIVSGAQWQWYEGTAANNFITPVGSPNAAPDASITITPAPGTHNYYLRASGGTAPCDGNVPASNTGNPAATVTINATGTWLGNNTNWADATNWCGGVPTAGSDALIPSGLLNYPVISASQQVRNITINSGASVSLNGTGELSIKGNYSNTAGTITNNGKIILNGTSVQSFPGTTAIVGAMNILETDNAAGISIDKSFSISGKLQPTNGTVSLNNNDITIKSDATATANVGQVGSGASFNYNGTGKFIVERFIPARRAWRLLTAPVTAASGGTINSNWQEGATKWPMGPATVASNPNDGFGTHISGGTNANGYDQNVNGNPSLKVFSSGAWSGLPVATSLYTKKVTDEPGYMLFVRGSRAVDLTFGVYTVPNNTVLRVSGHLNVANNTPISVTGTGLTVLGNPFASAINFNSIATLNGFSLGENKYYVWDPSLTGSYGVGAWVTLAYNGSTYDRTVTAFNDYTSSGGTQGIDNIGTIQSGAAVMVDLGATPKTINLDETIKVDGSTSAVFRVVNPQIRTNLYVENNNSTSLIDGVLVTYKPAYSNAADDLDVNKLPNFSENFGLKRNERILAIERRSPVNICDTVFFNLAQMRIRKYQLAFEPDSMNRDNLACYLEDSHLNTQTPVSLADKTTIPFSITDNASAANDRFRLIFKPWMRFNSCSAAVKEGDAMIHWNISGENDLEKYEIERSEDGTNFSVIGQSSGANEANNAALSFRDANISAGHYYYRIKANGKHGQYTYSPVARLTVLKSSPSLYVFPNPVTYGKIQLQFGYRQAAGKYHIALTSVDGKAIASRSINHTGGIATYSIIPGIHMAPGIYQLEVIMPDNNSELIKVSVQ